MAAVIICSDFGAQENKVCHVSSNHQGNANRRHSEISPRICQNGHCQKDKRKSVSEDAEKPFPHYWWECTLMQLLGKTVLMSPKKLKIELPCDPATPLLSIYLKDTILYLYLYVHCSVVDNSYDMETMLLSIDE